VRERLLRGVFYLIFSAITGLAVGVIDVFFSKGLTLVSNYRVQNFDKVIFFLPLVGALMIILYKKYGKGSLKGMGYVFEAAHMENVIIPKRLIPFSIVSTWATHLFGGSAGREGVAVQIGATVANTLAIRMQKIFNLNVKDLKKILISTGISAGFAGLFGTPFAATIFSLEILNMGVVEYRSLFPSFISAYVAYSVSNFFEINHFHFIVKNMPEKNIKNIMMFFIATFIFAFVGYCFAFFLKKFKSNKYITKIEPVKKIFFGGIILAILLWLTFKGRYSGLGTNLIDISFGSGELNSYDWLLKLFFTIFTLGIGFQGGEVTPIFSIGASLGAVLGVWFNIPIEFLAAIGYCSVFASSTNTFLASFLIGIEIFGYNMAGYLFVACAIAYLFSGEISIYEGQKKDHMKI
jgi:H+/Cl- antiporter ClcA